MTATAPAPPAPSTTSSSPSSAFRTDIQGLRALAVLLVVLFHAEVPGFDGGFVGVDVFFVISGFVITLALQRELAATGGIDFRRFYRRRARRLLPASAVMLTVVSLLSILATSPLGPQQSTASTGRAAGLFSANLALYRSPAGYFDAPALLDPFLHMWSLAVEEQFYLVFPLLTAVAWRLGRRTGSPLSTVGVVLAGGAVVSFAFSLVTSTAEGPVFGIADPAQLAYYASPIRAWEFIAGALLAVVSVRFTSVPASIRWVAGVGGLVALVVATVGFDETTAWPGTAAVVPVLGTVALVVAGHGGSGPARLWSTDTLVRLGDLSYSWYLWHWPAIVFARAVSDSFVVLLAAGIASLVPARWSYRFVEEPIRHAGWQGRHVIALAAVCIAVPVAAATALGVGADRHWGSEQIAELADGNRLHLDQQLGCGTVSVADPGACRFPAASSGDGGADDRIVLIGDSAAGQFTETIVAAGARTDRTVDVVTRHGCPFAPLEFAAPDLGACQRFVATSVEELLADPPATLVVATALDRYLVEPVAWRVPGAAGMATAPETKADAWLAAWSPVFERLGAAGTEVVVLSTTPRFDDWFLASCSTAQLLVAPTSCGAEADRADLLVERRLADDTMATALGPHGSMLDLFDELCPESTCTTHRGSTFDYRDGVHLSVGGAERLVDPVVAHLALAG